MQTKTRLLCSSLLLSLIIVLPAAAPSERASVSRHDEADHLIEQLRDLQLVKRNLEECYHAENRATIECVSILSRRSPQRLNGSLINKVFGYLAGTPEYERFVTARRALMQRPDYKRLHTDELFAEYMRLFESGWTRFWTRLEECQGSLSEKCPAQAHEGLAHRIPAKTVEFGHAQGSERSESGRAVSRQTVANTHAAKRLR